MRVKGQPANFFSLDSEEDDHGQTQALISYPRSLPTPGNENSSERGSGASSRAGKTDGQEGERLPPRRSTVSKDGETIDPGLNQVAALSPGRQEGGINHGRRQGKGVRLLPAFTAFGDKARTSSSNKSIKKHLSLIHI